MPVVRGRRGGGLGLNLLRHWLGGHVGAQPGQDPEELQEELSINAAQGLADLIRKQSMGTAVPAEARFYLRFVQNLRDNMLRQRFGLGRRICAMAHMIECMLLVGLANKRDALADTVAGGLQVAIKEQQVLAYYMDLLRNTAVVPKQTTIYRHRLTMHLAFCRLSQLEAAEWIASGGLARWGTLDSSPQARHNWLMVGFATMRLSDLTDALMHAHRLWGIRHSEEEEDVERAAESIRFLSARLELSPAVPTTCPHGRSSLAGKVHCLAHSTRLCSQSWRDCATLLNSTCSWNRRPRD